MVTQLSVPFVPSVTNARRMMSAKINLAGLVPSNIEKCLPKNVTFKQAWCAEAHPSFVAI
jgi:hypothetical protein